MPDLRKSEVEGREKNNTKQRRCEMLVTWTGQGTKVQLEDDERQEGGLSPNATSIASSPLGLYTGRLRTRAQLKAYSLHGTFQPTLDLDLIIGSDFKPFKFEEFGQIKSHGCGA